MAETHLQLNHDGTTSIRKTSLWPSKNEQRQEVIRQLFEQNNWQIATIVNVSGAFWKITVECPTDILKINLYISSIRDESRQPDEFKMQLGTTYPTSNEDGWITLILGIYVISEEGREDEYILSGYSTESYNFSTNPSIRGTRTSGLQKAKLLGMFCTERSVLFRPEFLYYYIEICADKSFALNTSSYISKSKKGILNNNFLCNYLTALRTKPFLLLAGISGTGKSRIVRKLAQATVTLELQQKYNKGYESKDFAEDRWTLHSPANFQLIQVKPNWHNSMDVVGYFSNIPEPHYVFTPFVEFVVRAWQNPTVPFFLCLDEMNLAPVEEYFAEFLSAIESRGFEKDDKGNKVYMTDPIVKPFKEYGMEVAGDMMRSLIDYLGENVEKKVEEQLLTRGLTLPANLMVIGTVNMDETTFSFSRKVLDRAMSIEMNEVDYDGFLQDTTDDGLRAIVADFGAEKSGEDVALNKLLVDRPIEAKEIKEELGEDAETVIGYLKKVNHLLEGTPFKLGYRAANEALIYLLASYDFGQTDRMAALDRFTMMKILSRVEGDEAKLSLSTDSKADMERLTKAGVDANEATKYGDLNLLTAMRCLFTTTFGEKKEEESEEKKTEWLSVKKIDSMIAQLRRDHFVSYWN